MNQQQTKRYDIVSPNPGYRHDSPAPRHNAADLQEVLEVRRRVELGEWPSEYLSHANGTGKEIPVLLRSRALALSVVRPKTAALVVTMDKPYSLGVEMADALLAMGAKLKVDLPHVQFCDPEMSYTSLLRDLASANHRALGHCFQVKYHYKAKRPEQYAKVDPCIFAVDLVGAPGHPSYPAGHGGTSGSAEAVIMRYFDLDNDGVAMVKDAAYQFAHWRTLLGVHFREDNDEGLRIGRKYVE